MSPPFRPVCPRRRNDFHTWTTGTAGRPGFSIEYQNPAQEEE